MLTTMSQNVQIVYQNMQDVISAGLMYLQAGLSTSSTNTTL